MRYDIACDTNIGNTVYNCFMEPFEVTDKTVVDTNNKSNRRITFLVKDLSNKIHVYDYEDLYTEHLEDEDDAEKSWVNWAKNNKDFFDIFDHITTMKELYKIAFSEGYEYKKILSRQEILQK